MGDRLLREYGTATTVTFELFEADGVNFRVDAVHATGDTTIMKDEGAEANTTNGFVDEGNGYSLALTATEMQAARIVIYVVDQTATKVWLDRAIHIETYGNASAQHAVNLNDSVRAGLTALPNAAADAAGGLPISDAGALDLDTEFGKIGSPTDFGSGTSTLAANLQDLADNGTATFDRSTDSLQALRDHVGDGTNLTEAGGTGDHLTAIDLPNQTMDITGNLSGSVGSVTGAVTLATDSVDAVAFAADAVDKIWAKAIAELSQAAPSATPSALNAIALLYMCARNEITVTSSEKTFSNNAGTVVFKKALSDDATTYTEAEMASGP